MGLIRLNHVIINFSFKIKEYQAFLHVGDGRVPVSLRSGMGDLVKRGMVELVIVV